MNKIGAPLGVTILALIAIALTSGQLYAQEARGTDSKGSAATHKALTAPGSIKSPLPAKNTTSKFSGLPLRPSKPIGLSEAPATGGWWYKLLACVVIVGGAMWLWKRRLLLKSPAQEHTLKILGRTPVGVRSELLIINVDGQKLLVGVTPQNIQRIAVLPDPHGDTSQVEAGATAPMETSDIEPGFEQFVTQAQQRFANIPARSGAPEALATAALSQAPEPAISANDPTANGDLLRLHPERRKAQ